MADFCGGFSKKRHRIAVAWRVWDGGAMAVVAVRRCRSSSQLRAHVDCRCRSCMRVRTAGVTAVAGCGGVREGRGWVQGRLAVGFSLRW